MRYPLRRQWPESIQGSSSSLHSAAASAAGMCHTQQEPQSSQAFGPSGTYGGGWLIEMGEHGRPEIQICNKPSFISLVSYFEKAIIISKAFTVYGGCAP